MYRLTGMMLPIVLLSSLLWGSGCVEQEDVALKIWVINAGDRPIVSVHMCADPREESWGPNLLDWPVGANAMGLLTVDFPGKQTRWVWPHLDGEGLMALAIVPGKADIFVVVRRTAAGDYRAEVLPPAHALASARFLLD